MTTNLIEAKSIGKVTAPTIYSFLQGNAKNIQGLQNKSIDLILTSPPYWKKRDYGNPDQIGQEGTPEEYTQELASTVNSWIPFLRPHASVFVNIADTVIDGFLAGIPSRFEIAMRESGWKVINQIIWAKTYGLPQPKRNRRLVSRHESIFHLVRKKKYFYDIHSLTQYLECPSNPGDVWRFHHTRCKIPHLAPFPAELGEHVLRLACPTHVCTVCGTPYRPVLEPTSALNRSRPQARRALELYEQSSLTEEHLAAIRAVGISDAGKGKKIQKGTGRNAAQIQKMAEEAKQVLGGYFREFTFAPKHLVGWTTCKCGESTNPGTVLDPFAGSGTTLRVAKALGFNAIGVDLNPPTVWPPED